MNNEKKAPVLTLEHLSPYLPYGMKVVSKINNYSYTLLGACKEEILIQDDLNGWYATNIFKPILRPLSDLTVEFFKENIDDAIVDFLINCEPEHNHFSVEVCDKVIGWTAISYEEYQLFFKNHFDVFGLTEKGLAIDINSIEGKETNS